MEQDVKFQQWAAYKALTRIFFELNEPLLLSDRAAYLKELEIFCEAAREKTSKNIATGA